MGGGGGGGGEKEKEAKQKTKETGKRVLDRKQHFEIEHSITRLGFVSIKGTTPHGTLHCDSLFHCVSIHVCTLILLVP